MEYLELLVTLRFDDDLHDHHNLSSAIRGIWGRTLRRTYCYQRKLSCLDCAMKNCTYVTIFEKKYGDHEQFHPYIIKAETLGKREIQVSFKFFGWLCDHYEKILISLLKMQESYLIIRGDRYPFIVESISSFDGKVVYEAGSQSITKPAVQKLKYSPALFSTARLTFLTPFRQKFKGRLMSRFYPEPFMKNLLNRIQFVNNNFTFDKMALPEQIDFSTIRAISDDMHWEEKYRRSFSQREKMSIGGLVGSVELTGFSPEAAGLVKLGELFHVGKQTTFGNGFYKTEEIE